MEDTKRIRFSNMAKFMFNEDQAIIFNRLNGQWIKVPKQCYDILELCNKEGLSWSALSESLADDEDREYMKQLIKLLDSMNCLYNDDEKIIENISFAITHRCNLKCIHCMVNAAFGQSDKEHFDTKTIARALLKKNPILIFDEATSMLDNETEEKIISILLDSFKDTTIILIAHRLSTVKNANTIYVLNNGTIMEHGNHDQLLEQKGIYYHLYNI